MQKKALNYIYLFILCVCLFSGPNCVFADEIPAATLIQAIYSEKDDAVNAKLMKVKDINYHTEKGVTPLMVAALKGRIGIVQKLLARGARVKDKDVSGMNALMAAAAQGQLEVTKLLIDKGSEIDAVSSSGYSALSLAASYGKLEVVKVLLSKGADPKHKTKNGLTPKELAGLENHPEIVKYIEEFLKTAK